jgi:hypothetical protein
MGMRIRYMDPNSHDILLMYPIYHILVLLCLGKRNWEKKKTRHFDMAGSGFKWVRLAKFVVWTPIFKQKQRAGDRD